MRTHATSLVLCIIIPTTISCDLGDGPDGDPPFYLDATVAVDKSLAVADGSDEITVTVTGTAGEELTLEVSGTDVGFVAPGDSISEIRVFLSDIEGTGVGTTRITATTPGEATVALKVDKVRTQQTVRFAAIAIATSTPVVSALKPGRAEHVLCVAANTRVGTLSSDSDSLTPSQVELSETQPSDLTCPDGLGFAKLSWLPAEGESQRITLRLNDESDNELATHQVDLIGTAFPGYDVVAGAINETATFVTVPLTVSYVAVEAIPAGPAANVPLSLTVVPSDGPTLIGSSSGNAVSTDRDGNVTLIYDVSASSGVFSLFVTPEGGATTHVTDVDLDD